MSNPVPVTDDQGWMTKTEAAAYLRCTKRYLEHQVTAGALVAFNPTGKLWRCRRAALDAFMVRSPNDQEVP